MNIRRRLRTTLGNYKRSSGSTHQDPAGTLEQDPGLILNVEKNPRDLWERIHMAALLVSVTRSLTTSLLLSRCNL